MADLPARDIATARLADLMAEPGCPVCVARDRSTARFVDVLLYESVNDVRFRRELDEARGFCAVHTERVLAANRSASGGTLGAAILFWAILSVRLPEISAAVDASGRSRRRRVDEARRPPDCPVCAHVRTIEADTLEQLHRLASEPAWAEALASAALCVTHLLVLLRDAPDETGWRSIGTRQVDRLRALRERLGGFAAHSSQDRLHEMTEEERRSADEAAAFLGGLGWSGTPHPGS